MCLSVIEVEGRRSVEIQMRPRDQSWIRDMWCHYGVGGGVLGRGGKNWGVFSGAVWQSGGWLGLVGRAVVDREVIADAGL